MQSKNLKDPAKQSKRYAFIAEHRGGPLTKENHCKTPIVVAISQRAWPLIDMLERTSKGGPKANIVWEAAADF